VQTFKHFFTGTAEIRKQAVIVDAKRGTSGSSTLVVNCTLLTPVTDDEVRRQIKSPILNTPMEARQVFLGSSVQVNVRKGDAFVLGGRIYPIRSVENWPFLETDEHLLRLIIEVIDK
jgi:hypothetical protein